MHIPRPNCCIIKRKTVSEHCPAHTTAQTCPTFSILKKKYQFSQSLTFGLEHFKIPLPKSGEDPPNIFFS